MYNTNSKQYIFRQSSGDLWNFFHDEKQGLCYSTLTKRNTWTNPVSLYKNAFQAFYADMDQDDRFHLLFQDIQGNVHYSYMDGDSMKTVPVLNSKSPSAYNKQLFMIPIKNIMYNFYVLQHESSSIFAFQVISDGKINNPKVIDYVANNAHPCAVTSDKTQNIYAFYQSSDGKYMQLGYKKFNVGQKFWSEFTPVTKYSGNCEYPRVVTDPNGIMHLCYQRHASKLYEMVYQQKMPDKNLWTTEVIVHSSAHPFENASVLWLGDNVIIYWIRDDIIYYNVGSQSGNTWGKPAKYNFPANKQLVCLSYKSNNINEADRIATKDIPGCFSGGLKFAFYQPGQDSAGESLSVEELRNLILESLKLLKGGVEELKETDFNLREDLNKLYNQQQEFEKDLVKCTVKLNQLESQLNQAKSHGSRLDGVSDELKDIRQKLEAINPAKPEETNDK